MGVNYFYTSRTSGRMTITTTISVRIGKGMTIQIKISLI